MTPARWMQVRDLLAQCLELEDCRRAAFLEAACGPDGDLRRELDTLLAASVQQDVFLDSSLPLSVEADCLLQPGDRLCHYTLLGLLGEGGMGSVYEAIDERDGTRVAIKVLHAQADLHDPMHHRFLREARLTSSLHHPHIVTIREVLTEEPHRAIVMEFIEGRSLDSAIGGERMAIQKVIELGAQIASGVACAHSAGIVHRDLKPANVMVTSGGMAKVLDFGAAKGARRTDASGEHFTSTASGVIIGSPAYLSPEQAMGKAADTQSDIFAFGALLFEMATGQKAFLRKTLLATLSAVVREQPPRADDVCPATPTWLADLIIRCLQKDPASRPATMAEVAEVLSGKGAEALRQASRCGHLYSRIKPLLKRILT